MRTVVLGWVVRCTPLNDPRKEWLLGDTTTLGPLFFPKEQAERVAERFNGNTENFGVFASAEEHEFPA